MRVFNRFLAAMVAALLAAGGILAAVEIVLATNNRRPWFVPHDDWYDAARRNAWDSPGVRWISIGLVIGGLVLLLLQLMRRPPLVLPLAPHNANLDAEVHRRSLERSLTRAVQGLDGVASAKVKIRGKRAKVRVGSTMRVPQDLPARVRATVEGQLQRLELQNPPEVRVDVQGRAA